MWEPDPGWTPVPAGRGSLTVGTWRVGDDAGEWLVKRVAVPAADDPPVLRRPDHPAYWRREVEVAAADLPLAGLVMPTCGRIEEDDEGWTLWTRWIDRVPIPAVDVAAALGVLATSSVVEAPWFARHLLPERVRLAEAHDGWPTLQRTVVADVADYFWQHRGSLLGRYDGLPTVPAHGDLVPANVLAPGIDGIVVADWAAFGLAPAGADLGYYALSTSEPLTWLLGAYLPALERAGGRVDGDAVAWAARLMIAYTVLSRAEWALARVAPGEGPLEAKVRHPAVAPYLRSLQRHLPDLEALVAEGL